MENARYRAFAVSVEMGSFSRAAEKMNYTPAGVCQLVNALEKELGFPLLTRDKKGVRPTADGEKILVVIRDLLHQEDRLSQLAAEINGLATGRIVIGAYPSIATQWLPSVIKGFHEAYPHIEVLLTEGIRQDLEASLDDRSIDLIFYSHCEPMPYEWIPLAEDPVMAILPPDHPFAGKDAYPVEQCQYENFIMPAVGKDADVLAVFRANGLSPKIAYSTMEDFVTTAMIEQGMGMTIMNDLVTQRWQFNVAKLPLDPPQSLTLGIALPSLEQAAPAVRRFVKYAVTKLTASEQPKSTK